LNGSEDAMRLEGKVALIAGAGGRQGTTIPIVFAREGARVALAGLVDDELRRIAERIGRDGGEAVYRAADLSSPQEAAQAVRLTLHEFGRIDILYNNTGVYSSWEHRTGEIDDAEWDRIVAVNLTSHFLVARVALREMARRRSGVVINVAAAPAAMLGGNVAYAAAKSGIIGMTKKMAREYASDNVRVNCICPMNIQASPDPLDPTPPRLLIQRDGTPEDVAYAALFLASDEAAWITGAALVIDGGAEALA
jgi:NAD(P)-dependent dehydrogenase (short-subunit alcohol dehydrogenase family)